MDSIYVLGFNFKETKFALLEKIVLSAEEVKEILELIQKKIPNIGTVILSTCNRLEIYCSILNHDPSVYITDIINILAIKKNICAKNLSTSNYTLRGEACAKHLFTVCAGLDSMIIGENFIVAQIKQAINLCKNHSSTNLNVMFNMALAVSKKIRNLNLSFVDAWGVRVANIVKQNLQELQNKKILFMGAGSMMPHVIQSCLQIAELEECSICNRTYENAEKIAKSINLDIIPIEMVSNKIDDYSILISCISDDENVFSNKMNTMENKLIIDLSMPPIISETCVLHNLTFTIQDIAKIIDNDKTIKKEICSNQNIAELLDNQVIEFEEWKQRREERL